MLPTFCPPTIWAISLEFYRKLSILAADDFLGACYRKLWPPKSYGLYFFPIWIDSRESPRFALRIAGPSKVRNHLFYCVFGAPPLNQVVEAPPGLSAFELSPCAKESGKCDVHLTSQIRVMRHLRSEDIATPWIPSEKRARTTTVWVFCRFVATCGPCMNFTTFWTSWKSFQRWSENNFKDDLAFCRKHFRFTKTREIMLIWNFRRNIPPSQKKMWESMSRLNGPTFVVLCWFWRAHSKNTQTTVAPLLSGSVTRPRGHRARQASYGVYLRSGQDP